MSEDPDSSRRPRDWTSAEKLAAIVEVGRLSEEELGIYLRENGLHMDNISDWKAQIEISLGRKPYSSKEESRLKKRVKKLEREVIRKDRALAEATALVVLSKKMRALWGARKKTPNTGKNRNNREYSDCPSSRGKTEAMLRNRWHRSTNNTALVGKSSVL